MLLLPSNSTLHSVACYNDMSYNIYITRIKCQSEIIKETSLYVTQSQLE